MPRSQYRLHTLDAQVQVEGGGVATDNGDVAFAPEQRVHFAAHVLADLEAVDAVEAHAIARRSVGVPAHHAYACGYGLVDHRHVGYRVVAADPDGVNFGRDQVLEGVDVERGVGRRTGSEDRLNVAELRGPLLEAEPGQCEHRVVEALGDDRDLVLPARYLPRTPSIPTTRMSPEHHWQAPQALGTPSVKYLLWSWWQRLRVFLPSLYFPFPRSQLLACCAPFMYVLFASCSVFYDVSSSLALSLLRPALHRQGPRTPFNSLAAPSGVDAAGPPRWPAGSRSLRRKCPKSR